jgi:hypothetical protein
MENSARCDQGHDQLSFSFDKEEIAKEGEFAAPKSHPERFENHQGSEEPKEIPIITQEERREVSREEVIIADNPPTRPSTVTSETKETNSVFYSDWDRSTWIKVIAAVLALLLIIGFCGWLLNQFMVDRSEVVKETKPPIEKPTPPPKDETPTPERDDKGLSERPQIKPSPAIMEYELEVYVFEKRKEDGNTVVVAEGVTLIFCGEEPVETAIIEGAYNCIAFTSDGEIVESATKKDSFPDNEGYAFVLTGPVTDCYSDDYGQFYVVIAGITAVFPQAPDTGIPPLDVGSENDIYFTREGEIIDIVH